MLTFFFTLFLLALGIAFPELYAPLALPQVKEAEMEYSKYMRHDSQIPVSKIQDMDVESKTTKASDVKSSEEEAEASEASPEQATSEEQEA
jgi:hypothetical protein